LNPLDPNNPKTAGRPVGLTVVSVLDTIQLRWNPLPLVDLTGFRVYRKLEGESDFSPIATVASDQHHYEDFSDRFDMEHSYRLTARAGRFESPPSDIVSITPGPTIAWVADYGERAIIKLTHDGKHELMRSRAFFNPLRLRVDTERNSVWVLDGFDGELGRLDLHGQVIGTYDRFLGAVGLDLDLSDGSLWVVDSLGRGLVVFDSLGTQLASLATLPKMAAMVFNPFSGELWTLSVPPVSLFRIVRQGSDLRVRESKLELLDRPSDMAIHHSTGIAWAALQNRLIRIMANGRTVQAVDHEFRHSTQVAIDQTTGCCWAVDYSPNMRDSRIVKFDSLGNLLFEARGFSRPQGLAANPFSGSCLVADTGAHRLVVISKTGTTEPAFTRVYAPYDIEIVSSRW